MAYALRQGDGWTAMHPRLVAPWVAAVALALLATLLPAAQVPVTGPRMVEAATPASRYFIESSWGEGITREQLTTSDTTTFTAVTGVFGPPYSAEAVRITIDGTGDLTFAAADGAPLTAGSYPDAVAAWNQTPGHPGLWGNGSWIPCSTSLTGSFEVLEIARSDGQITKLAVDFEMTCSGNSAAGAIRFNSSLPFAALTMDPHMLLEEPFGYVVLGEHKDVAYTFSNVGDTTLHFGTVSFAGTDAATFAAVSDACSGTSLAAGAACSLTVRFTPTTLGWKNAHLELAVDTPLGVRMSALSGIGAQASTTTLDTPPIAYAPDSPTLTGQVSPAPALGGLVTIDVDGAPFNNVGTDEAGHFSQLLYGLAPGDHTAQAHFVGGSQNSLTPSDSAIVPVKVGVSTTLQLTSTKSPALNSVPVTITATVTPHQGTLSGGTVEIVDAFDGSTIASGSVGPGTSTVSVTRTFATGSHVLTATYSGDGAFGPSSASLTQVSSPDTAVIASGLGVQYGTFYPVVDGYRDTVAIRGTLGESARVQIFVYSPTSVLVRSMDLGTRAAGSYSWAWNGRNTAGTLLPAGKYRIVQQLTDTATNPNRIRATFYVTLSRQKLTWYTATVTRYGSQYGASGDPGSGYVSTSKSSYSRGVRLSSGTSWAAVRYTFSLHAATVYKPLTFRVLGRSPNGTEGWAGLWNRTYGSASYATNYDTYQVGPAYKWYSMAFEPSAHRSGRTTYGEVVVVWDGSAELFDISKVQLTYRYGVLG